MGWGNIGHLCCIYMSVFSFIAEGIESVEIVEVIPLTPTIAENAVDLTVTCQGR